MDKVRQLLRLSMVNETGASAITDIVGSRVYPAEIVAVPNPTYPCVCFRINGGPLDAVTDVFRGTMRVWCWSAQNTGTYEDAIELYNAVMKYWHRASFNDWTLLRMAAMQVVATPAEMFDADVRAYAAVSDWVLFAGELIGS